MIQEPNAVEMMFLKLKTYIYIVSVHSEISYNPALMTYIVTTENVEVVVTILPNKIEWNPKEGTELCKEGRASVHVWLTTYWRQIMNYNAAWKCIYM